MSGKKTPGQLIRAYRKKLGVNQKTLGKILSVSLVELSLIENDKKQVSKLRRLYWSTIVPEFTPDMLTADGQEPVDG
ncbi:hypothetical protein [Endozoicomonas atrinae]|uniref:hypothetical protein n=1 Tax=Endozoicomonas atrinae TaxID=1333660 RepID=UPI00082417A6|nr:hypothetical protein [Endozoicomonas atrinae]